MLGLFACGAAGIVADRALDLPCACWLAFVGLALVSWLVALRSGWVRARSWISIVRQGAVLVAIFASAASWHHIYWNDYDPGDVAFVATNPSRPVCLRALVLSPPANLVKAPDPLAIPIHREQCLLDVRATELRTADNAWHPTSGSCRVRIRGHLTGIKPGDTVMVWGRLTRAHEAMNPGGWDASQFARAQRTLCVLDVKHPGCVQPLTAASAWNPTWYLPRLGGYFQRVLLARIGGEPGELAVAVLLGVRSHVEDATMESFLVTGTIHLLAISGLHVGIIACALLNLLAVLRLPRPAALIAVMLFCLGYTILVGCRAPVVRATVIVWVSCTAMLLYRPCLSFNTLAAAGTIVLGLNPTELFAAGAQLSFVAVAAMIWIVPKLTERSVGPVSRVFLGPHRSLPRWLAGRLVSRFLAVALATIAIWLFTLPLVTYHFNLISPIALGLNLFLWIPLALALVSGLLTMALAWAPAMIVAAPAAVCRSSMEVLNSTVQAGAGMAHGHFWVPGPPQWLIVLFYASLFLGLLVHSVRVRWKTLSGLLFGGLMAGWLGCAWLGPATRGELQMTFLSIGHGTCVMMQLPDGRVWLYDAGTCGNGRFAVQEISRFLWSRGIVRLDGVMLSHADLDHYNALPGLLRRFSIARVCTSRALLASPQPGIRSLRSALDRAGVPVVYLAAGDRLPLNSPVSVLVRHPAAEESLQDNEASLVLEIGYQGRRILLPGDLEGVGMERLLNAPPTDFDLVMAPHHGSRHSAPASFCAWAQPEWIIISGGRQALHVRQSPFRDSGATVLVTARHGAIHAKIVKGQLRVTAAVHET